MFDVSWGKSIEITEHIYSGRGTDPPHTGLVDVLTVHKGVALASRRGTKVTKIIIIKEKHMHTKFYSENNL
jgi:hypothetical protein